MLYAIYDAATGVIHRTVECAESMRLGQLQFGEAALPVEGVIDDGRYYVEDHSEIAARPDLPAPPATMAAGQSVAIPLPAGTRVLVDETDYGETDGAPLVLEFELDGDYRLALIPPGPERPRQDVIHVTPADPS